MVPLTFCMQTCNFLSCDYIEHCWVWLSAPLTLYRIICSCSFDIHDNTYFHIPNSLEHACVLGSIFELMNGDILHQMKWILSIYPTHSPIITRLIPTSKCTYIEVLYKPSPLLLYIGLLMIDLAFCLSHYYSTCNDPTLLWWIPFLRNISFEESWFEENFSFEATCNHFFCIVQLEDSTHHFIQRLLDC